MNIIVLGNGYDLAHGLPTKYVNFLDFIETIKFAMIGKEKLPINIKHIREGFEKEIQNNMLKHLENPEDKILKEIKELIENNFWINYFHYSKIKENWIDFEKEISNVIQSIDKDIKNKFDASIYSDIKHTSSHLRTISYINLSEYKTYIDLRNKLLEDLNNFIRCFEIYLAEFVENIPINPIFDILNIRNYNYERFGVISFNYTHTFQNLNSTAVVAVEPNGIKREIQIDYHYIHGEAKINNTVEDNNMVLGIGEYLEGEAKNKETDFIAFKKYYQRILKQTGSKYKSWLQSASINNHIIGHSLDVTDKDILRDLILQDISNTTIYYYNKNDLEKKIINLVKIIGQEELIKRTGENNIIFKDQKEIFHT